MNTVTSSKEDILIQALTELKVPKTEKAETQNSSSIHLQLVEEILTSHGFKGVDSPSGEKAGLFYISQPNGSQQFPDLLLIHKSKKRTRSGFKMKTLNFELKKGKGNCIFWNDGFPREDSLYLYSDSAGYNVLFTGEFVSKSDRKNYENICKSIEDLKNKNRKRRGKSPFNFFPRKATKQKIDKDDFDIEKVRELLGAFLKRI